MKKQKKIDVENGFFGENEDCECCECQSSTTKKVATGVACAAAGSALTLGGLFGYKKLKEYRAKKESRKCCCESDECEETVGPDTEKKSEF